MKIEDLEVEFSKISEDKKETSKLNPLVTSLILAGSVLALSGCYEYASYPSSYRSYPRQNYRTPSRMSCGCYGSCSCRNRRTPQRIIITPRRRSYSPCVPPSYRKPGYKNYMYHKYHPDRYKRR